MRYRIVADGELRDDEAARLTVGAVMRLFELGAPLAVTAERDGAGVVAEARLGVPETARAAPETAAEALGVETPAADYDDLRRRLEDVKLAGTRLTTGYRFRTNETAAEAAVRVVRDWLGEPPVHRAQQWDVPEELRHGDGGDLK
jgi:hypothetical protein